MELRYALYQYPHEQSALKGEGAFRNVRRVKCIEPEKEMIPSIFS